MRKINSTSAMRRVRPGEDEFTRESKRVFVRALKHEGARVRHQGGVEAGRDFRRELHPGFTRQANHHLRGSDRMRINPVDVGKRTSTHVMVDADKETVFESFQASAVDAVAFENNCGLIAAYHSTRLDNLIGKR